MLLFLTLPLKSIIRHVLMTTVNVFHELKLVLFIVHQLTTSCFLANCKQGFVLNHSSSKMNITLQGCFPFGQPQ